MFDFASAYRQLRTSERIFVDGYVQQVEHYATMNNLKLDQALKQVTNDDLDQRSIDILSQSLVRAAIMERIKELSEEAELSTMKTLKELRGMAYSSIGHYIEIDGYGVPMFDITKCTPEQLSAIKTLKFKEDAKGKQEIEIALHDKVHSIKLLMAYQGLMDEQHWRAEQAKQNQQKQISAGSSVDDAADLYAQSING